jgi:hypothetical protein
VSMNALSYNFTSGGGGWSLPAPLDTGWAGVAQTGLTTLAQWLATRNNNTTPGIGGSSLTPPSDPFGGITTAGMGGALVPAVAGAVVRYAPRVLALAKSLAKYVAPAVAIEMAQVLVADGVTGGGPYRTAAGNSAIAYRGDLAACKRLRKAGQAIGYARATGMRRSVRRRKC